MCVYDAVDGESESTDMHPSQAAAIKQQGDRKKGKIPSWYPPCRELNRGVSQFQYRW